MAPHTSLMKFGQLILRKVIKILSTRCQILRQMLHDRFQLRLCLRPRLGNLQLSLDPLVGIKGTYFQGKGRVQGRGREEREGRGREGGEGERRGRQGGEKKGGRWGKGTGEEERAGKGRLAIPILVCFWHCCYHLHPSHCHHLGIAQKQILILPFHRRLKAELT